MVGRVHEVVVENFKSYEGRVRIGPFRKFTCVIGPNGAGKSNLMDAISFVLGVRTKHLRGDRLQTLIHRKEGEAPEDNKRSAAVELVYISDDQGAAEGGAETSIVFRRVIQPAGEARFQVNGDAVSHADYLSRLEGVNILAEARNFLVFQGDVEAAAHRRGKDLTNFFEQVSGSIAFRDEYDQLAAEKAQKEDLARYMYTRRRNALHEKKRVSQQKEEAEKYQALAAEHRQLQAEFYLFRFHCLACREDEIVRSKAEAEAERTQFRREAEGLERELGSAEARHAEARNVAGRAERDVEAARQKLEASSPQSIKVRSQLAVQEERLKDLRVQAQRDARKLQQLEAETARLRGERESLEKDVEGLAEKARQPSPFTPDQREEFEQAQRTAQLQATESAARARELEARAKTLSGDRARLQQQVHGSRSRCSGLKRRIEDLQEAEAEARVAYERDAEASRVKSAELEQLRRDGQGHVEEQAQLKAERQQILHEIQDITATERQIANERRLANVSADLVQLMQGVHGRIIELCSTPQRRFRVAVNAALGGFVDAVVTDTAEGARRCVQHLKERMLDPLAFAPLDTLKVPVPDPQLKEALQGRPGLRYALDCLNFKERLRRVFQYFLHDVVVADSLDEGRHFLFEVLQPRGLGCRIVTLAGEIISGNGNLSVSSDAAREGSTRFDFAALEATRSRLEAIDRRLYQLQAVSSAGSGEGAVAEEEAQRLEAQARTSRQALERQGTELTERRAELRKLEGRAEQLVKDVADKAAEEAQLREEQADLEDRIGREAADEFRKLSERMGVDDVRLVEREWRRAREEAQAGEQEATQRLAAASSELALAERSLQECGQRTSGQAAADCEREVVTLKARGEALAEEAEELKREVEQLGARLTDSRATERAAEREAARRRAELAEGRRRCAERGRRLAALTAELQGVRGQRTGLLRQSVLEDVDVPLAEGIEVVQAVAASASAAAAPAASPLGGGAATASALAEAEADPAIDLSALPEEKRSIRGGQTAKLQEDEYRAELQRMAGELEVLRPNLKAIEQLALAAEQAESAGRDAAAAQREIKDVERRFEAVRLARRARFMACFQKVQDEIDTVYKRLTGGTANGASNVDGGSAYLDLEDEEDPFNGGVKFSAMPPTKRFCDIGLLSGGERTLAAMALLFAMQAYQRPPFLVLDEVDAHLDGPNVQALARYVGQSDCQTIVISLKDKLFSCGDGLVGISRDRRKEASVALTWDLARFRQPRAGVAAGPPGAPLAPAPLLPPSPVPPPVGGGESDIEMGDAQ